MSINKQEIIQFIQREIADTLGVSPGQVDATVDIDRFALNSSAVVSLVGTLEEYLNLELSPSLFFEHKTIAKSADYLVQEMAAQTEALA